MKFKSIALILVTSILLSGCLERGKFKYVTTVNQSFPFTLTKAGEFNESSSIKGNEIIRQILDLDLADDFIIKRVDIKNVNIGVNLNPASKATSLDYRIYVNNGTTIGRTVFLSKSGEAPVTQTVAGLSRWAVDKWLNSKGAEKVKAFLTDVLVDRSDIDGYSNDRVYTMEMNGIAYEGAFIADIKLNVIIDVTYETCEEVPIGLAQEKCIF